MEKSLRSSPTQISSLSMGVWRVHTLPKALFGAKLQQNAKTVLNSVTPFVDMVKEIYTIDPRLAAVYASTVPWASLDNSVSLFLSSSLLLAIEKHITSHNKTTSAVHTGWLLAAHLLWMFFMSSINWYSHKLASRLDRRVEMHFEALQMAENLRNTSNATQHDLSAKPDVLGACCSVATFAFKLLSLMGQLLLALDMARSLNDPIFAALSLINPLRHFLDDRNAFNRMFYYLYECGNDAFATKAAMQTMSSSVYQSEMYDPDLKNHVLREYVRASRKLVNLDDSSPTMQHQKRNISLLSGLMSHILSNLPLIHCVLTAIFNPGKFSLGSIAVLQQYTSCFETTVSGLGREMEQFQKDLATVRMFGRLLRRHRNIYAEAGCCKEVKQSSILTGVGRSIELRSVYFTYDHSPNDKPSYALRDINLTIKPNQVVVIVGKNGSGKSTLVKLLTGHQSPTKGDILINAICSNDCNRSDLLRSTAILNQDSPRFLFPLSVADNIGAGRPQAIRDKVLVNLAATRSGVQMNRFKNGADTYVKHPCPPIPSYLHAFFESQDENLLSALGGLEEIRMQAYDQGFSGGEMQRIAAAKTFMRLNDDTNHVDFLVLDEPMSSTDAEGEQQIVNNLIQLREGRTMVFVTHRFGHLTKVADLIVCMRDGGICETGTHAELMRLDGEYASLYRIQAEPFLDDFIVE